MSVSMFFSFCCFWLMARNCDFSLLSSISNCDLIRFLLGILWDLRWRRSPSERMYVFLCQALWDPWCTEFMGVKFLFLFFFWTNWIMWIWTTNPDKDRLVVNSALGLLVLFLSYSQHHSSSPQWPCTLSSVPRTLKAGGLKLQDPLLAIGFHSWSGCSVPRPSVFLLPLEFWPSNFFFLPFRQLLTIFKIFIIL